MTGEALSYKQETRCAVQLRARVAELERQNANTILSVGWTVRHMILLGTGADLQDPDAASHSSVEQGRREQGIAANAFRAYLIDTMSSGYGGAAEIYMFLAELRRPIHVFLEERGLMRLIQAYTPTDSGDASREPLELEWQQQKKSVFF